MDYLLLPVVLFATVIGAICGIGGGVIIKPVFDLLSSLDTSTINFLSGTTVLAMSLYSVINNFLNKKLDIKNNLFMALFAAVGGILGGRAFKILKDSVSAPKTAVAVQSLVLFVLVLAVYIYTLNKKKIQTRNIASNIERGILGFILGFISSFLGIGGGPINIAIFAYFLSLDSKKAADASLFVIVFGQFANLLTTVVTNTVPKVDILLLVLMIATGILGGIIGRKLNKKFSNEMIDKLFNYANILIMVICLYNFIRNII